jgi:hypothetical protein
VPTRTSEGKFPKSNILKPFSIVATNRPSSVHDLSAEIAGKEIFIAPNAPSPGVTVAYIVENGAPVEFSSLMRRDA